MTWQSKKQLVIQHFPTFSAHFCYGFIELQVFTKVLIAALICSGSEGQTATISAKSEGSSTGSFCPVFGFCL